MSVIIKSAFAAIFNNHHNHLQEEQLKKLPTITAQQDFEESLDKLLLEAGSPKTTLEKVFKSFNLLNLKNLHKAITPKALAELEVLGLTPPPSALDTAAARYYTYCALPAAMIGRFLGYIILIPKNVVSNLASSTLATLRAKPRQSNESKFNQKTTDPIQDETLSSLFALISVYTLIFSKFNTIKELYLSRFHSPRTAALVATLGLAVYGLLFYITKYQFKIDIPQDIDDKNAYQNLNDWMLAGVIHRGREKVEEEKLLSQGLTPLPNQPTNIVFLTGPSGAGKTQLVRNLVWSCLYDKTSYHYGKTVFSINCAKLLQKPKMIQAFLEEVKGRESNVILFLDEAHNTTPKIGPSLLELCKTEFLDRNIRCIMATTTEEYEESIASNTAFVSRTAPVEVTPMSDEETKNLLCETVMTHFNQSLDFSPDVYNQIIETGRSHPTYQPRFNPRKSLQILQKVAFQVLQWRPTKLSSQLQAAQDKAIKLKSTCQHRMKNAQWSASTEGQKKLTKLKTAQEKVQTLTTKIEKQTEHYLEIKTIQAVASAYHSEYTKTTFQLAQETTAHAATEKRYLFTKFIALPALQRLLGTKVTQFEQDFEEKIPLKIDAAFVQAQFHT
jgi:Cdc6-like AAA superfamily ATPase